MSLREKAAKINFGSITPTAVTHEIRPAKTAPGVMMGEANDRRSELLKENEYLRAQAAKVNDLELRYDQTVQEIKTWEGAKQVRTLDPMLIRRGSMANRDTINFSSEEFTAFKQEILESGGNVVPIKVRQIADADGYVYELIYGHRRLQAALETGTPVLSLIDNLDDKAAYEEMERENRGHMKPSPWEQGLSYERALRSGLYPSIRKLAAALGVDQSNANKAMALAQLPAEVIHAFRSPLVIQLRWGTALRNAINKDSDLVIRKAQELAMVDPKLPPIQVLKELVASTQVKTDTHTVGEVPEPHLTMRLMGSGGKEVGSVKQEGIRTKLLIKIPLSQERQRELSEIVAKFLNATVG